MKSLALLHRNHVVKVTFSFILALAAWSVAHAQQYATDGTTPLGLSPGTPTGSYPLSGFDNVNLFNEAAAGAAERAASELPETLYYYTDEATAAAIKESGQIGAPGAMEGFLTKKGNLSPLQAQIELALPAKNTARAVFAVDAQATPTLLRAGRVTGNVFNRAGGGFEFVFNGPVKGGFTQIR
jgi:hypothetical protein